MGASPDKLPADRGAAALTRMFKPVTGLDPDGREAQFHPVPVAGLRTDLMTGFDLYLRGRRREKFVLYRRSDFVFTEVHRGKLENSRVRYLYVRATDHDPYVRYLETNLEGIVADGSVPADQKSLIVYECSTALVCAALQRPWSGENHRRAKRLVRSTVDHLLRGADHLAGMIRMLASDYRIYTHSVNVCVLGLGLAERVGLSVEELNDLGTGLLLHDIGVSEISPAVLAKLSGQRPLTDEERTAYQTHAQRGADLLRRTQQLPGSALAVVRQHHERCSGQGYPAGVRGPRIHLYAKIAGLADTFDALTTRGRGKGALDSFQALQVVRDEMPRDFNPDLLRSLVLMMGRKDASPMPKTGRNRAAA